MMFSAASSPQLWEDVSDIRSSADIDTSFEQELCNISLREEIFSLLSLVIISLSSSDTSRSIPFDTSVAMLSFFSSSAFATWVERPSEINQIK